MITVSKLSNFVNFENNYFKNIVFKNVKKTLLFFTILAPFEIKADIQNFVDF